MERDERGHWLPGRSANPGGRPGVPDVIKATLRELSPRAVDAWASCWTVTTNASGLRRRRRSWTGIWDDRQSRPISL